MILKLLNWTFASAMHVRLSMLQCSSMLTAEWSLRTFVIWSDLITMLTSHLLMWMPCLLTRRLSTSHISARSPRRSSSTTRTHRANSRRSSSDSRRSMHLSLPLLSSLLSTAFRFHSLLVRCPMLLHRIISLLVRIRTVTATWRNLTPDCPDPFSISYYQL